ncbi:MAG: biopolymer transporter ExbD [Chromatiales bacterium]|jgi:biopolymer transport protein ExbD
MNLRPKRQEPPQVNLTPLIDVVFLLLIFFMVSTTFERETRIRVELPEADQELVAEEEPGPLDVTVDAQGRFYVDQREVVSTDIEALKRALGKALEGRRDRPVVLITADAKTPHQAVITVMDAASQMGLVDMSFAAKKPTTD